MRALGILCLGLCVAAIGCGPGQRPAPPVPDAGQQSDGGNPDAGVPDAGLPDAGAPDAGQPDAGQPDAGVPDAGEPDAGQPDAGAPDAGAPGETIDISGFTFTPSDFTVDAGTVIAVHNSDGFTHTVTSESADNAFTPGSVNGVSFDTGGVSPDGTVTITIPSNAPSGTVIPFYCAVHTSGMSPANGHVTVR